MANVTEFAVKVIDNASAALGRIGQSVNGAKVAFAALAVALPVAKLGQLVSRSLEAADAAGKAAAGIGISTQAYTALAHAAQMSGVSQEAMRAATTRLNQAISAAPGAINPVLTQLQGIGVATRTATGEMRSFDAVFADVADVFANAADGAEKSGLAIALFGEQGAKLVPLLNQGSSGIANMTAQAEKLGLIMSDDLAKSSEAVNDNMALLGSVMQGSVNKAMVVIAPVFEEITGKLINMTTESNLVEDAAEGITIAFRGLMSAATIVSAVFDALGTAIGGVVASISFVLEGEFSKAFETIKSTSSDVGDTVSAALTDINNQWDESAQAAARATARQAAQVGKQLDTIRRFNVETEKERQAREKAEADSNKRAQAAKAELLKFGEENARREAEERKKWELDAYLFNASLADQEQADATARLIAKTDELAVWRENQIISEEQYNLMREQLALDYSARFGGIEDQIRKQSVEFSKATNAEKLSMLYQFGKETLAAISGQSKAAFNVLKGIAIAEAVVSTFKGVALTLGSYPFPFNLAFAAGHLAIGMAQVNKIKGQSYGGAAHGGLDYVPNESTYLLQQGERVLSPRQNRDLTDFMDQGAGGGATIGTVEIHILENATNADAFARMDRAEIRERLGQPVVTALNEMWRIGIAPDFAASAT